MTDPIERAAIIRTGLYHIHWAIDEAEMQLPLLKQGWFESPEAWRARLMSTINRIYDLKRFAAEMERDHPRRPPPSSADE